jgi:hypothetical protein
MSITVLFTIVKLWNQPRCPSMDEWITWYIYIPWKGIRWKGKEMRAKNRG